MGQTEGSAIYFAADFEVQKAQVCPMRDYFLAVQAVMMQAGAGKNPYAIGVYGSGLLCATLLDAGIVSFTWLSESGGFLGTPEFDKSKRWTVKKSLAQTSLCGLKGSNNPDRDDYEDNVARVDFGDWLAGGGAAMATRTRVRART